MRLILAIALLATAVTGLALAQGADRDPLGSSECKAARHELEQALSEPAGHRQGPSPRLARARQQAALLCLGPDSGGRARSGAPQPPQAVPPPAISVRPAPSPPAIASVPIAAPQPQPAIPRAATVTTCDPGGCWDSDGRRLNNVGPFLMSPRGLCNLQGALLSCP